MTIYCTYLTIYSGNKLPPFYIGYTKVDSIEKGYHGTVVSKLYKTIWQEELKQNPHLFKTIILRKYEDKKEAQQRELFLQKSLNVIMNPLYINRAIAGHSDNTGMVMINDGEKCWKIYKTDPLPEGCSYGMTEERRQKRFGVGKGVKKKHKNKEKWKEAVRETVKRLWKEGVYDGKDSGMTLEARKHISDAIKELWANGVYEKKIYVDMSGEKNPFYKKKHKPETNEINRQKHLNKVAAVDQDGNKVYCTKEEFESNPNLRGVNVGKSFYNNGKENILILKTDPIPEGFVKGRISNWQKQKY